MAEQTPSRPARRQLSLFLPEAQRSLVEPIRQRLDPIQHGLIPAHVTLCRYDELPGLRQLTGQLECLEPFSITMKFGEPQELPDGCVLICPSLGAEEFQALRQLILGKEARVHGAHLTLLHPRNPTGAIRDLAGISRELANLVIPFDIISLIEQYGCDPWQVKSVYGSAV